MTGAALRKLRKAGGLSVAKAAKMVHVAPRTWVRYETMRKVPETAAHLFRLLVQESLDTARANAVGSVQT